MVRATRAGSPSSARSGSWRFASCAGLPRGRQSADTPAAEAPAAAPTRRQPPHGRGAGRQGIRPVPGRRRDRSGTPIRSPIRTACSTGATNALLPRDLSPWGMFMQADWVVKAVMIGLAFASVVTWTVWLAKSLELAACQAAHAARCCAALQAAASLGRSGRGRCTRRRGAAAALVQAADHELHLSAGLDADGHQGAYRLGVRADRARRRRARRGAAPACSPPSARPRPSSGCSARSGAS